MKRRWKQTAGFTLVELIVVIAILGILAGVAVPTYSGYVKKANEANDNQLLMAVNTAFASAGIANGIDVKTLPNGSQKLVIDSGTKKLNYGESELVKEVPAVKASFTTYMGSDSVFKYFDHLYFVNGAFIGKNTGALADAAKSGWFGSGFGDGDDKGQGVAKDILKAFDKINEWLGTDTGNMEYFLAQTPKDLADRLGFTDMANVGVENFAADAAGRGAQEVLDGARNMLALLNKAYDGSTVSDENLVKYYKETLKGDALTDFLNDSHEEQVLAAKNGLELGFGDLHLTGEQVGAIMANAGNIKNDAGISGLGGMYALAAGFYNSSYYDAATMGSKPGNYGEFNAVQTAGRNGGQAFQQYLTSDQALKDMEAYVSFMSYLSTGNIEGTYAEDGLEYIKEALGW